MHIAICDDNVADRKQLERLLGRESDNRKDNTGVFYTDSFGQCFKMHSKRMSYDLFFLSPTEDEPDCIAFAARLKDEGVTAPIAICVDENAYSQFSNNEALSELLFIKKPVLKAELSSLLDQAIVLKENQIPTIELRTPKDTYYVLEDDIMYAIAKGQYVEVFLKDQSSCEVLDTMCNFYANIALFTHFVAISDRVTVNFAYVQKRIGPLIYLKNGVRLHCDLLGIKDYKTRYEEFRKENYD